MTRRFIFRIPPLPDVSVYFVSAPRYLHGGMGMSERILPRYAYSST
jgi:hypothetical protein